MNKPRKSLLVAFVLIFVLSACSSGTGGVAVSGENGVPGGQAALNRDILSQYSADFQVQFSGNSGWNYQLKTRKSPDLREVSLHLEGLEKAHNPGDIRLVTDGVQSWMIGEGTDQECVQFPNQQGMDPSFIYPESLVSLADLSGDFKLTGEEASAKSAPGGAVTLLHFRATGAASGPWKNATIDIWQDKASGMLHKFTMQADGEDPFFEGGSGRLTANYLASALGQQPIEPVAGCEIGVRLPDEISSYVRLPGMASFNSPQSVDALQQFYQTMMSLENWTEAAAPAQTGSATVLSFQRDTQDVQIFIEAAAEGGSQVKLLFVQSQ